VHNSNEKDLFRLGKKVALIRVVAPCNLKSIDFRVGFLLPSSG